MVDVIYFGTIGRVHYKSGQMNGLPPAVRLAQMRFEADEFALVSANVPSLLTDAGPVFGINQDAEDAMFSAHYGQDGRAGLNIGKQGVSSIG